MNAMLCLSGNTVFNKKGVLVVLLWMFTSEYIVMELILSNVLKSESVFLSTRAGVIVSMFFYPLFGWLADVHYGRYKVIKYSLHIIWLISVLYTLMLVVVNLLVAYGVLEDLQNKQHAITMAWYLILGLGVGGLMANIVQFGFDQLQDATSNEVSSYIRWCALLWVISMPVVKALRDYLSSSVLIHSLIVSGLLSVMLCLDYFSFSWFVRKSVSKNPLVTIFQVLKFAMKNKYPQLRSAYFFWKGTICSRIDLAKSKYGGPFTAEQVEDTKIFWRILALISCATFFGSLYLLIRDVEQNEEYQFKSIARESESHFIKVLMNILISYSGTIVLAAGIPVFEIFASSRIKMYINGIPMLSKILVGMVLILLAVTGNMTLEALRHHLNYNDSANSNTCVYDLSDYKADNTYLLDYKWFVIPRMLENFAYYVLIVTTGEFLCAQSPYSMKGLLFGLVFGLLGIFCAVNYALFLPIKMVIRNSPISSQIGCGTVYFASVLLILLFLTACFCCACRFYKPRQRSPTEREERSIDINYYS